MYIKRIVGALNTCTVTLTYHVPILLRSSY